MADIEQTTTMGEIKLSNDVIATIAGVAATQIEGVVGTSSGVVEGIVELFTGTQASKGVKVEIRDTEVTITISVIVAYGVFIPDLACRIQENVKRTVEDMTGLHVRQINVHINGIKVKT